MKKSKVYFLPQNSFAKVPALIEQVAGDIFNKGDFVALKIHFGEKGNKGFINPKWVRPIVDMLKNKRTNPFLTDTNTIYRGARGDAVNHLALAKGHGFKIEKVGAPVIIADGLRGNEYEKIKVDGKHFNEVKIAKGIIDAHSMIALSHTKGHVLTGFGGAIKNLGMGCAAKSAKYEMHSSVEPRVLVDKCAACGQCVEWCPSGALQLGDDKITLDGDKCIGCGECIQACNYGALEIPWDVPAELVQERLVEHAAGAIKDKPVCYVNYMHFISKHCDCFTSDGEPPLLDDLGILVSLDPVAIDQASLDIINKAAGKDLFKELHGKDYNIQLEYAQELGLGSREYTFEVGP